MINNLKFCEELQTSLNIKHKNYIKLMVKHGYLTYTPLKNNYGPKYGDVAKSQ